MVSHLPIQKPGFKPKAEPIQTTKKGCLIHLKKRRALKRPTGSSYDHLLSVSSLLRLFRVWSFFPGGPN